MKELIVYDKFSWYLSDEKDSQKINFVKEYLTKIMHWLNENKLLSEEGKEVFELGINEDFSINSAMLSETANSLFQKHYSDWLKAIGRTLSVNMGYWNKLLKSQK